MGLTLLLPLRLGRPSKLLHELPDKAFVKVKTWRGAPTGKTGVELGLPGDVDRRLEEVNDLLDQEVVRPDF